MKEQKSQMDFDKKTVLKEIVDGFEDFKIKRQRTKEQSTKEQKVEAKQQNFATFVERLKKFDFNQALHYIEEIKEKVEKGEYINVEEYLSLLALYKKLKEKGLITHFVNSDKIFINWDIRHNEIDRLVFKYFSLLLEGKEVDFEAKENENFKLLKEIIEEDGDALLKRDCEVFWACYHHPLGYALLNALGKRNSYKEFKAIYDFLTKIEGEQIKIEEKEKDDDDIRKEIFYVKNEVLKEIEEIKQEVKALKNELKEKDFEFGEFERGSEKEVLERLSEVETKLRNLEDRLEIIENKEEKESLLEEFGEKDEEFENKLKEIEERLNEIEEKLVDVEEMFKKEFKEDGEEVEDLYEEKINELKEQYDRKISKLEEEIESLKAKIEEKEEKEETEEERREEKEKEEEEEEETLEKVEEQKKKVEEKKGFFKSLLDKFHSLPPVVKYAIYLVIGLVLFLLVYYGL